MGLGMQAARAAAYKGYLMSCPVRVLGVGGGSLIAAMSFCIACSLSLWSFPAVSIKFVAVCSILVVVSLSLAMIGRRVPLAPSRHLWMDVKISATNVLLVRSVNRIEMECMDSSRVLGIFVLPLCVVALSRGCRMLLIVALG